MAALGVKQALALFEGRIEGKTPKEIEACVVAFLRDERAAVDHLIGAFRFDEEKGTIEPRGRGTDYDTLRHHARCTVVQRAPASKVVDAFRAGINALRVGHSTTAPPIELEPASLAVFPGLERLFASRVERVPKLPRLTELHLERSPIEVLDLAEFPALEHLSLSGLPELRRIANWSVPRLRSLTLASVPNVGALALGEVTELERAIVHDAGVPVDLSGLTKLKRVEIKSAGKDLGMLRDAKHLEELRVDADRNLRSLAGLEEHQALTRLEVNDAMLRDLSALAGLGRLISADLSLVTSLETLRAGGEKRCSLRRLSVKGPLESLAGIEACPALEVFVASSCEELRDVSSLASAKQLADLWLMFTPRLVDLEPLAGLTKLEAIHLQGNEPRSKLAPPSLAGACVPMLVVDDRARKPRPSASKPAPAASNTPAARAKRL